MIVKRMFFEFNQSAGDLVFANTDSVLCFMTFRRPATATPSRHHRVLTGMDALLFSVLAAWAASQQVQVTASVH